MEFTAALMRLVKPMQISTVNALSNMANPNCVNVLGNTGTFSHDNSSASNNARMAAVNSNRAIRIINVANPVGSQVRAFIVLIFTNTLAANNCQTVRCAELLDTNQITVKLITKLHCHSLIQC